MVPFMMFALPFAFAAIIGGQRRPDRFMWLLAAVSVILFVGLRHKVGMDWNNYLRMIFKAENVADWQDLLDVSEPLYALVLYLGSLTGFGIYAVNFFTTIIVVLGLFRFLRTTPEPWIALVAALPVYITVVTMSVNRQAVAAAILLWLVADWYKLSAPKRTLFIFFAAGFHFSALLFLAFVGMDLKVRLWMKVVALSVFGALVVYILQSTGQADYYDGAYGRGQTELTQSSGAWMHVSINALPAFFYFLLPRYRSLLFPTSLARQMAICSMATLPLVAVASAAAGRISLYWFPVSIWVWSAIPQIFAPRMRPLIRIFISLSMVTVMFSWLLYANSSKAHIPYRNALFVEPWELHIGVVP